MSERKIPSIPQYGCRLRAHKSYAQRYFRKHPFIKHLVDMCEQAGHPCTSQEEGWQHSTPLLSARNFVYSPVLLEMAQESPEYSASLIEVMSSLGTMKAIDHAFCLLGVFATTASALFPDGTEEEAEKLLLSQGILFALENNEYMRDLFNADMPEEMIVEMFSQAISESLASWVAK